LRRMVSLEFASGFRLLDCPVHVHPGGRAWVAVPGKPLLDKAGRHKGDANGKAVDPLVAVWRDQAMSDRFRRAVLGETRGRNFQFRCPTSNGSRRWTL
jgi:hypothetical protein